MNRRSRLLKCEDPKRRSSTSWEKFNWILRERKSSSSAPDDKLSEQAHSAPNFINSDIARPRHRTFVSSHFAFAPDLWTTSTVDTIFISSDFLSSINCELIILASGRSIRETRRAWIERDNRPTLGRRAKDLFLIWKIIRFINWHEAGTERLDWR